MAVPTAQVNLLADLAFLGAAGGATRFRRVRQLYTNLSANGAVSLVHGLLTENGTPATPVDVSLDPASNNNFYLVPQSNNLGWDAVNIYVFVGNLSGGAHSVYATIVF